MIYSKKILTRCFERAEVKCEGDCRLWLIGQNMDGKTEFVYQDDHGNLTDDPYAVTGRNMGEPRFRDLKTVAEEEYGNFSKFKAVYHLYDSFYFQHVY